MASNAKGNPFQRGKTWTYIYYTKERNGKRKQHWVGGFKTKAEAEKELKKTKALIELDQFKSPSQMKFSTLADEWFELHRKSIAANTVSLYSSFLRNHIKPAFADRKISSIKPADIEAFFYVLRDEKKLKQGSLISIRTILNMIFDYAVRDEYLLDNPIAKVKLPRNDEKKRKSTVLSPQEIARLLIAVEGSIIETPVNLMCLYGLRIGEALGVLEEDIDFEKNTLCISHQIAKITEKRGEQPEVYGIKGLKTESSYRTLELSDKSRDVILKQMKKNAENRKEHKFTYEEGHLLSCKKDGRHISKALFFYHFRKVLEKAELPRIRIHDLRHSYATLCIDLNVPLKVISMALGHSSIKTTADIYADSISAKKELSDKVANAITIDINGSQSANKLA